MVHKSGRLHFSQIAVRQQWDANFGYCGETSFVTCGMYWGQYLSQYDVRQLMLKKGLKQNDQEAQILIGENDDKCAKVLKLTYQTWKQSPMFVRKPDSNRFMQWMKSHTDNDVPVIFTTYLNNSFGKSVGSKGGKDEDDDDDEPEEQEYDHIVTCMGFQTGHDGVDICHMCDNYPWSDGKPGSKLNAEPVLYPMPVTTFGNSWKKANHAKSPLYSLPSGPENFGIAITGIVDEEKVCKHVQLTTPTQEPCMPEGGCARPPVVPLTLTIYMWDLEPTVPYYLYKYNDPKNVPTKGFNAAAAVAQHRWTVTKPIEAPPGAPVILEDKIMSGDMAFYRCVPASAK